MARTFTITSGAITLDFDDDDFSVEWGGWAPAIATRRPDPLAGIGTYDEVIERIRIKIKGTVAGDVEGNYQVLARLINDQAPRWWAGENVDPVIWTYKPEGSGFIPTLQAVILGPPPGRSGLEFPGDYEAFNAGAVMIGAELSFVRRGAWLTPTDNATDAAANNPAVLSVNFASATALYYSPYKATFTDTLGAGANQAPAAGFVCLTGEEDRIRLLNAYEFSKTAPSGGTFDNSTQGGTVAINTASIIPAALGEYRANGFMSGISGSTAFNTDARRFMVFASIRNLSTSSFRAYASVDQGVSISRGPYRFIPTGLIPTYLEFGVMDLTDSAINVSLVFEPNNTGTGRLHIDQVVVVAVDGDATNILSFDAPDTAILDFDGDEIVIDDRSLTHPVPLADMRFSGTVTNSILFNGGNPYLERIGTRVSGIILGTSGSDWRLVRSDGTTPMGFNMRIDSHRAYLAPR